MRKQSGQVHSRESSATLQLTVSLLYQKEFCDTIKTKKEESVTVYSVRLSSSDVSWLVFGKPFPQTGNRGLRKAFSRHALGKAFFKYTPGHKKADRIRKGRRSA